MGKIFVLDDDLDEELDEVLDELQEEDLLLECLSDFLQGWISLLLTFTINLIGISFDFLHFL